MRSAALVPCVARASVLACARAHASPCFRCLRAQNSARALMSERAQTVRVEESKPAQLDSELLRDAVAKELFMLASFFLRTGQGGGKSQPMRHAVWSADPACI